MKLAPIVKSGRMHASATILAKRSFKSATSLVRDNLKEINVVGYFKDFHLLIINTIEGSSEADNSESLHFRGRYCFRIYQKGEC